MLAPPHVCCCGLRYYFSFLSQRRFCPTHNLTPLRPPRRRQAKNACSVDMPPATLAEYEQTHSRPGSPDALFEPWASPSPLPRLFGPVWCVPDATETSDEVRSYSIHTTNAYGAELPC